MPADTILAAAVQGRQGTDDRQMGRAGHGKRKAEKNRTVPVSHLVRHSPDDSLNDGFVARQIRVAAVLSKTGDRHVNQPGIAGVEHIEADTQTIRPTRGPALQEHLGAISELQQSVPRTWPLEIELDTALTAIENRRGGRLMGSTGVPAGWFDPHHVRPVVCQQPRGPGTGQPA